MNDVNLQTRSNSSGEVTFRHVRTASSRRSASVPKIKTLPGRKLTDAVVRSSSGMDYSFTSDLAEPISKRIRDESRETVANGKLEVDQVSSKKLVTRVFHCFRSIVVLAISSSLILFVAVLGFGWMQSRCEFLHNLESDLLEFRQNFSTTIIGQPYASAGLPSVLADFQVDKFREPRIVWCVGWTGVGKSKSLDLIKHLATHSSVQYILPSLLPDANNELQEFIARTIRGMNSCKKNILIVDGWDEKYDNTTLKFISGFLAGVKDKVKEIPHMNQLLVFVAGSRNGEVINREYLIRRERGERRDEIPLGAFIDIISNTEEFSIIKNLGPLTVVPFLPMEVEHVAECANREIIKLRKLANISGYKILENASQEIILRRLLEHLPLLPSDHLVIPATGCKNVVSALTHLMQNEELTLE